MQSNVRTRLLRLMFQWEFILLVFFVIVMLVLSNMSPHFWRTFNLMNALFIFLEKSIVALAVCMVILCGEIDVSLASIIALASMTMGLVARTGAGIPLVVLSGVGTGLLAGLFNGILISRLRIPAIGITLGTMSLFRGIAHAVLKDEAVTEYPSGFSTIGNGFVGETLVPIPLVIFVGLAVIMVAVIHKTKFGRRLYVTGSSSGVALFSGVNVANVKTVVFAITGLFCGIAAVLLTSRIGTTRPNIAMQWELEIITMVVLGGVSISGGKGSLLGVIISIFLTGYLRYGLGLLNVQGRVVVIFLGLLLIVAILLPDSLRKLQDRLRSRFDRQLKEKDGVG